MQLAQVRGQGVAFDLAPLSVVRVVPRLHLTQEVHHLGVMAVPVKTQQVKRMSDSRKDRKRGAKRCKPTLNSQTNSWLLLQATSLAGEQGMKAVSPL